MSDLLALQKLEAEALDAREAASASSKLRQAAEDAEKLADKRASDADAAVFAWIRARRDAGRQARGLE